MVKHLKMKLLIKVILLLLFNIGVKSYDISNEKELLTVEDIPELKYLDVNVDPCENFYNFSCGNFAKYNPLPPEEKAWDNYYIVQKEVDDQLKVILNSAKQDNDLKAVRKLKDIYQACMGYERYGYYNLNEMAEVVKNTLGGWSFIDERNSDRSFSWNNIADIVAEHGLQLFFSYTIDFDPRNTSETWIIINKDTLALPNYIIAPMEEKQDEDIFKHIVKHTRANEDLLQNPYVQYLLNITNTLCYNLDCRQGIKPIERAVIDSFNIMRNISNSPNYPRRENLAESYLDVNISDFQKWTDKIQTNFNTKINWLQFFKRSFKNSNAKITGSTKIYVGQTAAIVNILDLVDKTDKDVLGNFIIYRLTSYMAPDSNEQMWDTYREHFKKLNYIVAADRESYCTKRVVNSQMSFVLSQQYYTYFFDHRKIKNAKKLIKDLRSSYKSILDNKGWLDGQNLQNAQNKLEKMLELIAFPEFLYNNTKLEEYYENLQVCKHDHFSNMRRLRAFTFVKSVNMLGHKKDAKRWTNSPLQVNAYYSKVFNRIAFPAAIMNAPFYAGKFSVTDYGRIGSIIGHELTHGFDSEGYKYDENGNYNAIFNKTVTDVFNKSSSCFIKQYSNYYIDEIEMFVNGGKSLAENIADNGGLREAYKAYLKTISSEGIALRTEQYNSKQLFFIAFGTNYCKIDTKESLTLMYNDSHAPNRFRVNGVVSNMEEFSQTFNCPIGSNMNPVDKCILW